MNIRNHTEEIICAGFGGQGILFMGKLIAESGLAGGKSVTWMPAYGAEVRGGTAYSMVKVSDEAVASPLIAHPTVVIAMNGPSLAKYEAMIRPGGLLIVNTSIAGRVDKKKDVAVVNLPLTDIAVKLGDPRVANIVAIGALLKKTKLLAMRSTVKALESLFHGRENTLARNREALEKGYKLI